MEDRTHHRVPIALAIAFALLFIAPEAQADDGPGPFTWPTDVVVHDNPNSVVVKADQHGTIPGGASSSGGGSDCHLDPIGTIGQLFVDSFGTQLKQGLMPYMLLCGKGTGGLVWLDPNGGSPAPPVDPQTVAMHLRDEIPVPRAKIEINPTRGLVGVDSWFWLDGYNGSPIDDSTNTFGQLVEVEARATRYEWSFGDGDTVVAKTVGRPYPHRSQIRHIYQRSSAGLTPGYQVQVSFDFSVRYRVDGGRWIELPSISRIAQTSYPVRESQSVIEQ